MYYKLSNALDFRCIYQWLLEKFGKETFFQITPVVDAILRCIKILTEEYKGNQNPDYIGGYVILFESIIENDNNYFNTILTFYNLNIEDFEYESFLCTCISQEDKKITWVERLYIMADFHIVLIYPIIQEGGN